MRQCPTRYPTKHMPLGLCTSPTCPKVTKPAPFRGRELGWDVYSEMFIIRFLQWLKFMIKCPAGIITQTDWKNTFFRALEVMKGRFIANPVGLLDSSKWKDSQSSVEPYNSLTLQQLHPWPPSCFPKQVPRNNTSNKEQTTKNPATNHKKQHNNQPKISYNLQSDFGIVSAPTQWHLFAVGSFSSCRSLHSSDCLSPASAEVVHQRINVKRFVSHWVFSCNIAFC